MNRLIALFLGLLLSSVCAAQTSFNTVGSDDGTAISGYDVVAFHTVGEARRGKPQFSHMHGGAKWIFESEENLTAFQSSPDKYLPEWGGQCAWAVSEGTLSTKLLSGDFAMIDDRLYLFSFGNSRKDSARDDFLEGRTPTGLRVRNGKYHWPGLKQGLEAGSQVQPGSSNYRRSPFEASR